LIIYFHILHINSLYAEQNRALLDTLRLHPSNNNQGHIVLYSTLLIGHRKHKGHMRLSSWPFVPRKLQQTNRQDMVFIRPPGISDGAFQLRMDNIWFCKLLLLFKIYTKTDTGMQYLECAYVSVLEEYKGHRKPGHIQHILHILHILIYWSTTAWLAQCQSTIVYERREQAQVLYVIPVSSILGRLPLVPVGATGTIPFAMRRETADFPGAFCDKSANSGDGCRWWYVNSWALGWGTKQ
jgi:hypothetical protein